MCALKYCVSLLLLKQKLAGRSHPVVEQWWFTHFSRKIKLSKVCRAARISFGNASGLDLFKFLNCSSLLEVEFILLTAVFVRGVFRFSGICWFQVA